MSEKEDIKYLKLAIENSKKSYLEGNFPAGAIVVKDDTILASEVSSPYPGLFHADSKSVTSAFEKEGPLNDATLYVGLEPCLMCIGVAYWSGIRRVVYAISKSKVSSDYYESPTKIKPLLELFNEKINLYQIKSLEDEALQIIRDWESTLDK